ncbi:MAG: T9SS type A sorting domain-containing protein, partial [Bacteroidota bacterium]|nr:T9SS type A sorting domain-containing protein [Bacteroidota bacterium]
GNNFLAATTVSNSMTVSPKDTIVNFITGKIPIDAKRWFQLTNASNGLDALFDGVTSGNVQTGWGKILDNYDSYYPVADGEQIDLSGVKMFDGEGSNYSQPMTLAIITSDGQRINVAKFTGSQYNRWVGPDPGKSDQFNLQTTFKNIKYLVINSWNFFPTEIEFYGNYLAGPLATRAEKKSVPLNHMVGVNGFEWNFEQPNNPGNIDPQDFKAAKTFMGFRHYLDWEKLEASRGSYSFNPTIMGGWNYDDLYDSCKTAGIEVLACIKTLPGWMLNSYPADQRDPENVPVEFGKNFSDPVSYIEQSKMAFQFAARYGSNKNIDRSLLRVNNVPRWNGDNVNAVKVGLGTVQYIECDNERDKWWKGRKAYQTAFEYAANLSAFYDGNKNTMGKGVGVKNADPNMKVVMAGTALASTDYLKGMVDWCRRNRGYNADGTVNLCWDVVNYHLYSNDSKSSQNGNATRGAAPEVSGAADVANQFLQVAHKYCNDMPVWVTELGYDINQGSPFKAIPIGNKSALETEADWILRSSLMYSRAGIDRIFFYEMYDDNIWNSQQFSSSGLINADKTRKPAADYLYQVNRLFGEYSFQKTMNDFPIVDYYKFNNNAMYMIVVPDEKGSTAGYILDLGNATSAQIFTPKAGSDNMDMKIVSTDNGKLYLNATETPQFITPISSLSGYNLQNEIQKNNISAKNQDFKKTVTLYPNPACDYVNVIINNNNFNEVKIKIFGTSGSVYKNFEFIKPNNNFSQSININSLPTGYYMIEINQGKNKIVKKIFKSR